jgi:hypothetical protein
MNFLADEGVDKQIVVRLREEGYSVSYVPEMAPGISDDIVLELANKEGSILWNKENIRTYIDYERYDFEKQVDLSQLGGIKFYNLIDNQKGLKDYFMTTANVFPDKTNMFILNQEISQYLYKNPKIGHSNDFKHDILQSYQELFIDILKPTYIVLNKVEELIKNHRNIIGIQIRAGDVYMNVGPYQPIKDLNQIKSYLLNIKCYIEQEICNNSYSIYITSDLNNILDYARPVFKNIIYNNDPVQHIDRNSVNGTDFSKIFVDLYILSQKTTNMFISDYSNLGRIAALTSTHNEIYDLKCNKLKKIKLVSKSELLI